MTTKPKAKKYRIRRQGAEAVAAAASQDVPASGAVSAKESEASVAEAIAQIRKEGLTGRQLRMARRIARKQGLAPTSDFDAVRLLRLQGIDPFQRSSMLELVVPANQQPQPGSIQLPQTIPVPGSNLPSTELGNAAQRAKEILQIQRDIVRRRRRKQLLLLARLAVFVFLPTFFAGYYYYFIATPMYATKSEFVIQKADSPMGGVGGMFAGTQFATSQDSITVQGYLQSRGAMLRLDKDHGFKEHFSQDWIDPIQALPKDATNEAAYRLYKQHVKIGFDPTEGTIKMEVSAADPKVSVEFSEALISYAEERVDQLTKRLRENQMEDARQSYVEAAAAVRKAQEDLIKVQESSQVISGDVEVGLLTNRISALELQLTQDELSLQEMLANARPNPAKVEPLQRKIAFLKSKIQSFRDQLTESTADGKSIASKSSEIALAQAELETRNLMMQAALQQLETARLEANKQVRYLSVSVQPIALDEPTYPRKFENTLLAFLVFAGIYLMASLTASILREQVSS